VLPRGPRRGQVNFRSHNSCLSLGASSPGRRRACVLFGVPSGAGIPRQDYPATRPGSPSPRLGGVGWACCHRFSASARLLPAGRGAAGGGPRASSEGRTGPRSEPSPRTVRAPPRCHRLPRRSWPWATPPPGRGAVGMAFRPIPRPTGRAWAAGAGTASGPSPPGSYPLPLPCGRRGGFHAPTGCLDGGGGGAAVQPA